MTYKDKPLAMPATAIPFMFIRALTIYLYSPSCDDRKYEEKYSTYG